MAYVFGIEGVPVFEMLFVVMCLMIIGLFFVLMEIKKLKMLLREEKGDITRFEEDLSKFEEDEGQDPHAKVKAYVQNAMQSGMNQKQVEDSLMDKGWSKEQVDKVFEGMG